MRRPATGEPVLIDLGLVRSSDDKPDGRNSTTSIVDGHAVGVGTPGYSAPEQFSGGNISPAADIHALGILANACFKGKPPRLWAGIIRRSTSSIPEQRNAALINRSPKPYPESGITYSLRGESYLNFLNQKWPEDKDIRNVYVDGENEIIRFGGPLTYREARQDAYKQALEAHRRDAERRRKSHDLRDAGVREAF